MFDFTLTMGLRASGREYWEVKRGRIRGKVRGGKALQSSGCHDCYRRTKASNLGKNEGLCNIPEPVLEQRFKELKELQPA